MGYDTQFKGTLKFKEPLNLEQLCYLDQFLNNEDADEHPEWIRPENNNASYIQLKLNGRKTGIEWDNSEKFYDAVDAVNLVIVNMKAKYPDFELTGKMLARGDEIDDIWFLTIVDGVAVEEKITLE